MNPKLTPERLRRHAAVYIRQSTPGQVTHNQESQRRQYGLADRARELGFAAVTVIDEDLGRSGSGFVERPGFQRLLGEVCSGDVGVMADLGTLAIFQAWRMELITMVRWQASPATATLAPAEHSFGKRAR